MARAGLVGKGLLYLVLGLLAVNVATGSGSTTKSGAIESVAQGAVGKVLILILAVTLVALVAWKALQAISGDPVEGSEAFDRVKYAIKGVLYAGSAATAVTVLIANWSGDGGGGGDGESGTEEATGLVMDWPGGRWLVVLAGLIAIGYGLYHLYKHVLEVEFMDRLVVDDDIELMGRRGEEALEVAGRVGYAARSGVTIAIGVFLAIAGITHDEDEAKGISGVLQELTDVTWGQILLWLLALGFVLFGLFSLAEARYRRAT